ncbi:MAG: hypothetical protein JJ992_07265, partial [Planctomycetes bacterium]|nr:hypothetical protein [Planctomycetota bacterium]
MTARRLAKSHFLWLSLATTGVSLMCAPMLFAAKRSDESEAHAPQSTLDVETMDRLVVEDWIDADRRYSKAGAPANEDAATVTTAEDA